MSRMELVRRACFGILLGSQVVLAQVALAAPGPMAPTIATPELAELLAGKQASGQAEGFVLVDVRGEQEAAVSVIPGAITVAEFERDAVSHQGKLVIPYCTVGGRSGAYARKLASEGWNVRNYAGSIIAWATSGQPLVTPDGNPTRRVHTYNARIDAPAGYEQVFD